MSTTVMQHEDSSEQLDSMEFKAIPQENGTVHIDQESMLTKQFHEEFERQEQEEEDIMEFSELTRVASDQNMDTIKQIASDFVKTLSQEALEIVRDKMSPEVVVKAETPIPTFEVTSPQEPVSDHFQFQIGFRSHFVTYFDSETEADMYLKSTEESQAVEDTESEELTEDKNTSKTEGVGGQTSTDHSQEIAEDIWAGEDAVMLRKSKTTFSMKSKTDSESTTSELNKKSSDRHSGTDQDSYEFHTAHGSSSRPSSSDVDAMLSAHSSNNTRSGSSMTTTTEYDTAQSHTDHSSSYHTAASSLSSRSLGSGHMASVEHSETSDTLIDYSIEHDNRVSTPSGCASEELPHDEQDEPLGLVRSPEMFFIQQDSKLNGSVITLISSSASDTATVIQQEEMKATTHQETAAIDVMQKSNITESTSSTTSEKPIVSSGEILSGIEELKKDSEEHSQKSQITRVVSFDTSNLEQISKTSSHLLKDQKSFDSDFGSRPESELKDFESRPQSMSEAMFNEDFKSPDVSSSKNESDSEMDLLKKNADPFTRPDSPEPPQEDNSPMDEKNVKTEIAFSTHFTQVIEDEEYEKLEEVESFDVFQAVDIEEGEQITKAKLRGTQSFDLNLGTSPPVVNKPLNMVWPASADLNMEDGLEPEKKALHSESEDEIPSEKLQMVEIEDPSWDEDTADELIQPATSTTNQENIFPYNPPLDQIIEEDEPEEAQLKEIQQLKESLSSTPEFEALDKRALNLRINEKDKSSMSSLQEFEIFEQQMQGGGSGSGSRGSLGSQDSLESGLPANTKLYKKNFKIQSKDHGDTSSQGSSGSLSEFEQMEDACVKAENLEDKAKTQEVVLSEIEEGHESQISESDSCETLSQGDAKSDDSESEFTHRMHQIDEIIRQAQSNVETFDIQQPQDYMTRIMEASTDSLEPPKLLNQMVTSTDSLEDQNVAQIMKISTDSIELTKKPDSSHQVMVASTDSLESGSTNTRATASMLSSYASHTSDTYVSDFDQDNRRSGYDSGLDRLLESDAESLMSTCTTTSAATTVTTSQCRVSYGFNVSEVYLPGEVGGLVSTIERTVEMPAEVTKIQFKGPEAEVKMNEYVQSLSTQAGSSSDRSTSLQEVESVDAAGNVIHKRVIHHNVYPDQEHHQ